VSVSGVRAELAGDLMLALPAGVVMLDYYANPDNIGGPTVVVGIRKGDRGDAGCAPNLAMDVYGIVGKVDPGPADDELDGLLDQLLTALDGIGYANWSTFDRAVFSDTWPCYLITVEVSP
jgi:hypothetical protein